MKNIFSIVLLIVFLSSCSIDDGRNFDLDIVPISEVEMPTAYRVDSITQIPIKYYRPTDCHAFSNFYYNSIGNERTVAVYCTKAIGSNCTPLDNYSITVNLNFKPRETGTYHFRFWSGFNEEGVDQYIEHEIVVDH